MPVPTTCRLIRLLERTVAEATERMAAIPAAAKGVSASHHPHRLPKPWLDSIFAFMERRIESRS